MSQHGERIVQGFVGEMIGASVMTVIRMTAHRAGLIDKTVPQAMTETLSRRVRPLPGGRVTRRSPSSSTSGTARSGARERRSPSATDPRQQPAPSSVS